MIELKSRLSAIFRYSFLTAISIFGLIAIIATGGGGGGGSTNSPVTPAIIDQDSAESTMGLVMINSELSENLTSITDSFTGTLEAGPGQPEESLSPTPALVTPILRFIEKQISKSGNFFVAGSESFNESCANSGSINGSLTWDGVDQPGDCSQISNLEGNLSLSNCGEFYPLIVDGTTTFSISGQMCNPSSISIQYTDYSISSDSEPVSMSMDSFSININNIQWNGAIATHQSMVFNGDIQGNFNGNNFSSEYKDYTMDIDTVNDIDLTIVLSGELTGGCISGWVTVVTETPLSVSSYLDCPTAGELTLYGEGNMSVIFNNDGSVDIGGAHYNSCNDAVDDCV